MYCAKIKNYFMILQKKKKTRGKGKERKGKEKKKEEKRREGERKGREEDKGLVTYTKNQVENACPQNTSQHCSSFELLGDPFPPLFV